MTNDLINYAYKVKPPFKKTLNNAVQRASEFTNTSRLGGSGGWGRDMPKKGLKNHTPFSYHAYVPPSFTSF